MGGAKLAKVPVSASSPQATVVDLANPSPGQEVGWLTGTDTAVFVTSAKGVTQVDPNNPATQTPFAAGAVPPVRISAENGILWTASYTAPSGTTRTGTLEGFDIADPGRHTNAVTFTAPADGYQTKLELVGKEFWLKVQTKDGKKGLQPFTITG
jgi:hypothetical protein